GARGSVKSAIGIVRSTALAQGKGAVTTPATPAGDGSDVVTLEGTAIKLVNGHLAGSSLEDAAQLGDFKIGTSNDYVAIANESGKPCFSFTEATASQPAKVGDVTTMSSTSACGTP